MIGYIYKITNLLNNSIYIGKRQKPYFDKNYWGSGVVVTRAIKKYGKENFKREIICWCETVEELCKQEIYWIKWYRDRDFISYNIAKGGEGGCGSHTEEQKLWLSQHRIGAKNPMYGKHHSQETIIKMKISSPHKKKIILDDGTIFESIHDCARALGCSNQHINNVALGRKKHAKGHTLKYYN